MPEDSNMKPASTPDVPWQDLSYKFDGQWLPDVDSTLIGPNNYQTLQNLRYIDDGLECVSGYTKVNSTAIGGTVKVANGHQLRSNKTQTSYTLVQGVLAATGQGTVYCNRVDPDGSQTNFDHQTGGTVHRLDTSGNEYRDDASVNLQGRFSDAPQGNIAYCNGEESTIFGGDEQQVAACFSVTTTLGSELITTEFNRTFGGASNWTNIDFDNYDEETDGVLTVYADTNDAQSFKLPQASDAQTVVGTKYRLTLTQSESGTQFFQVYDESESQLIGLVNTPGTSSFDFIATSTGGLLLRGMGGPSYDTPAKFDNFSLKAITEDDVVDVTDKVQNTLLSEGNYFSINAASAHTVYVFTTRPIQAMTIYPRSANTINSTLTVQTWTGSGFSGDIMDVDGTSVDSKALANNGTVTFTSHTDGTSVPRHFEELYLYCYSFTLSAGSTTIYHITVDPAMQTIKDVWDGVYRQPIQFQVLDVSSYFDYTLQVQESSDLNSPVGAMLDGLTTTDKMYIMFEDKMSAIKFTMLGDLVNALTETISMKYWNGTDYIAISIDDGTMLSGTTSLGTTGLVSWDPAPDESPRTLFGSFGYVYEFSFSGALTGTKGTGSGEGGIEVVVDICTGIPAQLTVPAFDWSAIYGSRLMLGSYAKGDEGNRMDYSVSNGPDVWNGIDSSDNGKQSLYFGGNEKIVAGTQIYNRFGANVYSMLLVLKQTEVYILVGDTPEEFTIYPVAKTIGCIAPLSLTTAEIGMDLGGGLTRNVALWLSHSGPMMFDGAVLVPINGIDSYFDPTDSRYIKFSLMDKAIGWFDSVYKEYNICIPSGSTATTNNTWLVFDLSKRKWFKKVCATSHFPQSAFDVMNPTTGKKMNYAGKSDGFMVQLEDGTYWDDGNPTGITQSVTTGDFYPTNNMWDVTTIRKHRLLLKDVAEVSEVTNTATIKHYLNTATTPSTVGTVDLTSNTGNEKLVKVIDDMNKTGVQHAFNYSVTTTNVDKGLQPISWGIQYRPERKDNTAN